MGSVAAEDRAGGEVLLVEVAGPAAVELGRLTVPHRLLGTVATSAVVRRVEWPADVLVWASDAPVPGSISHRFPQLVTPLAHPVFHVRFDPSVATPMAWSFRCNICGTTNERIEPLPGGRSCKRCLSNLRYRSTAHALTTHIHGRAVALVDAPERPDLHVLGISDWPRLARALARAFTYVNTHLDEEPRLDLTVPPPPDMVGRHDIVLAGDVLEHVAPPLEAALVNLRRLIRPGGVAIVTVPWTRGDHHIERFPNLFRWEMRDERGQAVLVNERRDGATERFDELRFHGPGRSLEMRVFTRASLLESLVEAGFESIRVFDDAAVQHGIAHQPGRPAPVIARVPGGPG